MRVWKALETPGVYLLHWPRKHQHTLARTHIQCAFAVCMSFVHALSVVSHAGMTPTTLWHAYIHELRTL
jgi:hypothetical protein